MRFHRFSIYLIISLFLSTQYIFSETDYEIEYENLRTSVYNSNIANENDINILYKKTTSLIGTKDKVNNLIEKSKCDYLMGLFYIDIENIPQAITYLQNSMDLAEESIEIKPTAQGYIALGESLAQICPIMPTSYLIANGLKVGNIAKKALKLDNRLGAARYLVCSIIAYAPVPFRNFSKAEEIYLEILEKDKIDKEDCFNTYISLGYIHYQKKEFSEADKWFELAAEIYPHNKFLQSLQSREYQKDDFITVDVEPIIDNMMED